MSRERGIVARVSVAEDYGFIRVDGGTEVFLHKSELRQPEALTVGAIVDFAMIPGRNGRRRAVDCRLVGFSSSGLEEIHG